MKHSFCLVVFAICAALHRSQGQGAPPPPTPPKMDSIVSYDSLRQFVLFTNLQVERRAGPPEGMPQMPQMPEMPQMPQMPPAPGEESFTRKRRSAKGVGGSMPTRKG